MQQPAAGLRQRIGNDPLDELLRARGEVPDPQPRQRYTAGASVAGGSGERRAWLRAMACSKGYSSRASASSTASSPSRQRQSSCVIPLSCEPTVRPSRIRRRF